MEADLDVLGEPVVVPDSIIDLSTRTEIDMSADPYVGVDLILVAKSVLIETEIEMGVELGVVIAESVPVTDAVFDLIVRMDDMVYLSVFCIFRLFTLFKLPYD